MPKQMPVIHILRTDSPLGVLTLGASPQGLCGAWFDDQQHAPNETARQRWQAAPDHPVLQATAGWLQAYFGGSKTTFDGPLDFSAGTPFQQSVWRALLAIPSGRSQSYGDLAQQLGRPSAARAVGAAVGRNPMGIIVPCHRVIGAQGQLTGYAGGLWRKQALLRLEGHRLTRSVSDSLFPE